ncbi:MAG: hypothetical protein ACE5G0_20530 [Rhodothermales bacterium]
MLDHLNLASFIPLLNTVFRLDPAEGEPFDVELVEVTDKTPDWSDGEQFSLIFRGPLEHPLQQRIYEMDHPALGAFGLFLVPVARRKSGFLYEAVFNRITLPE